MFKVFSPNTFNVQRFEKSNYSLDTDIICRLYIFWPCMLLVIDLISLFEYEQRSGVMKLINGPSYKASANELKVANRSSHKPSEGNAELS